MNKVTESFNILNVLHGLVKSGSDKKDSDAKTRTKDERQANELVENVLKSLKLKYHGYKKEKGKEGYLFRYIVEIGNDEYVVKSYLIYDTGYFSMCLWSRDEQDLVQVVTLGYMKNYYTMRSIAKERLKQWLNKR